MQDEHADACTCFRCRLQRPRLVPTGDIDRVHGEIAQIITALREEFANTLHAERTNIMARIDDLQATVSGIAPAVDRLIALHADVAAKLAAAGQEDPRIGQAADELAAIKAKIEAVAPPPAEPAP